MPAFPARLLIRFALVLSLGQAVQAQSIDYRGRVLEKLRMQPVAGAEVKSGGLATLTDAQGRFTLRGDPSAVQRALPGSAPFTREGRTLLVKSPGAGTALRLERWEASGRRLVGVEGTLPAGTHRAELIPPGDFSGFVRVTLGPHSRTARVVAIGSIVQVTWMAERATPATAKRAAAQVTVSKDRLLPETLSPASAAADLGDIVLDYPPRRPGLGSPPPYGALVLFPAGGDSVLARARLDSVWVHKLNPWRQSQGLGQTPVLWKVTADPESPPGSFRPSLLPCCRPRDGSPEWGYDDIITRKPFRDYQLHLEFNLMGDADGNEDTSGWCNSGVYLTGSQELQIQTPDPRSATQSYWRLHDMATLINEKVPDRNMHRGPGKWQSYDVTWRAPRSSPGKVTVYWNGEKVHDNVDWGSGAGNPTGFALQNEKGTDVRFRNVWIKELDIAEPRTDFGY